MKVKVITEELAKLYEKQGYLEDSLSCYSELYKKTGKQDFADAIARIKNKIGPDKKETPNNDYAQALKKKLEKMSDYKDSKGKSNRAMLLFEQWVNMMVLEKKVQKFNEIKVS